MKNRQLIFICDKIKAVENEIASLKERQLTVPVIQKYSTNALIPLGVTVTNFNHLAILDIRWGMIVLTTDFKTLSKAANWWELLPILQLERHLSNERIETIKRTRRRFNIPFDETKERTRCLWTEFIQTNESLFEYFKSVCLNRYATTVNEQVDSELRQKESYLARLKRTRKRLLIESLLQKK